MAKGEPGRKPPKASQYSLSEKDYAWMDSKLTPQPNSIVPTRIKLTGALQKVAKKTFIRAPKYPQATFDRRYAECKADPAWKTYRRGELAPRRDDRSAGMAGGYPDAGVVARRDPRACPGGP